MSYFECQKYFCFVLIPATFPGFVILVAIVAKYYGMWLEFSFGTRYFQKICFKYNFSYNLVPDYITLHDNVYCMTPHFHVQSFNPFQIKFMKIAAHARLNDLSIINLVIILKPILFLINCNGFHF